MSRPSADRAGRTRIAVVGASTTAGLYLRERLAQRGIPGDRVDLYGASQGEAVISEYDGEARLVQEPRPAEAAGHDVLFVCEPGEPSIRLAESMGPDALVVDLVACMDDGKFLPRVHMDINPEAARGSPLAVPHPLSILLADLVQPLDRELALAELVAVILRPVSDFGPDGVEELRQQTVGLLNFAQVPAETFGRQLAFNIVPQRCLAGQEARLEERLGRDLAAVLGWERNRAAVRLLAAPVFFGHSLQMRLRFEGPASTSRIEELLRESSVSPPSDSADRATPMDVSEERATCCYEIAEDGLGGFWVMAVAGETERAGADHAVRLADAVFGL